MIGPPLSPPPPPPPPTPYPIASVATSQATAGIGANVAQRLIPDPVQHVGMYVTLVQTRYLPTVGGPRYPISARTLPAPDALSSAASCIVVVGCFHGSAIIVSHDYGREDDLHVGRFGVVQLDDVAPAKARSVAVRVVVGGGGGRALLVVPTSASTMVMMTSLSSGPG